MWMFVEKIKNLGKNPSARHLMGFPVELEWKDVPTAEAAVQDDRIMADGRPAYAWWNEIQMLRREKEQSQKDTISLQDQFIVLKIAKWFRMQDVLTNDVIIRIKFSMDLTPEALANDPGKFCSIEPKSPH